MDTNRNMSKHPSRKGMPMRARYCLVFLFLIALVWKPTWAESQDSAGEVVKREVLKAWDSYIAAFQLAVPTLSLLGPTLRPPTKWGIVV